MEGWLCKAGLKIHCYPTEDYCSLAVLCLLRGSYRELKIQRAFFFLLCMKSGNTSHIPYSFQVGGELHISLHGHLSSGKKKDLIKHLNLKE